MTTFTDSQGNVFSLKLTVGAVDRIVGAGLPDLLSGNPQLIGQFYDSPLVAAKAVAVLIKDQLETLGVKGNPLDRFDGQTLKAALDAFYQEVVLFFQAAQRNDLETLCVEMRRLKAGQAEAQTEAVKQLSEKILSELPASLPSILAASPSGNS